ncbi:MAG: hypothetical protein WAX89_01100 [Alphaproteobacteria bacterium]
MEKWLSPLCVALMPTYPLLPRATRQQVAQEAAGFICSQMRRQPLWMRLPLQILALKLTVLVRLLGSVPPLLEKLPAFGLALRFFRAMTTIVFYEHDAVRTALHLPTKAAHIHTQREKFKQVAHD